MKICFRKQGTVACLLVVLLVAVVAKDPLKDFKLKSRAQELGPTGLLSQRESLTMLTNKRLPAN